MIRFSFVKIILKNQKRTLKGSSFISSDWRAIFPMMNSFNSSGISIPKLLRIVINLCFGTVPSLYKEFSAF